MISSQGPGYMSERHITLCRTRDGPERGSRRLVAWKGLPREVMPIKSNRHNPSSEERDSVNLHWSSHFSRAYTICGTMSSKKDNASHVNQEPPLSPPPRLQRHTQRVMMKHLKDDFLQSQSKWWHYWKVAIVSFIIRQITDLSDSSSFSSPRSSSALELFRKRLESRSDSVRASSNLPSRQTSNISHSLPPVCNTRRVLYFFPAGPTVFPRRPVVFVCCPRTRTPQ